MNDGKLKQITKDLSRAGLYRSETTPMVPRQLKCSIQAFYAFKRDFDPEIQFEKKCNTEKVLPSHHPGLLHDGAGNLILRRAPASLREAIARDLVESTKLDSFSSKFRLTALLISRGIRDQETIDDLMPKEQLTYQEFVSYQPRVDRLISSARLQFFTKNKFIQHEVGLEIWRKFEAAWSSLTQKQKSALDIHVMCADPTSLEASAKRLKISKSAFKERVDSGIRKIENYFPELQQLKDKRPKPITSVVSRARKFQRKKNAPKPEVLKKWINETTPEIKNILDWDAVYWKGKARLPRRFKLDKF